MEIKNKKLAALWQFVKFGMVGAFNTIFSYIIYNFCYYVFHSGVHIANITAFVITVFSAYLLQSRFVFKQDKNGEKRVWWKVLIKTYISYSFTGLFLTELLLMLWLNVINLGQYLGGACEWLAGFGMNLQPQDLAASLAPILNMVITIPTNFLINKLWAYRQKKPAKAPDANDGSKQQ
ncbi:MAG: GtrA family protein [Oscillospiraceae bacterium]